MTHTAPSPWRGYLICSIERTGSNLLAQALTRIGLAGRPIEYFNPTFQHQPTMRAILGECSLTDGLNKVLSAGTTPNGVFGAKVHLSHFRHFGLRMAGRWSDLEQTIVYETLKSRLPDLLREDDALALLRKRFSNLDWQSSAYASLHAHLPDLRFVWLTRRNMVARAISECLARKTGRWYLPKGKAKPADLQAESGFNLEELHIRYCVGVFYEELWRRFFKAHQISPYRITYEELAGNYEASIAGVLTFLDVCSSETTIPAPISAKQSATPSAEWENLYRQWSAQAKS
jgi:LPS sulfotransferase NodH